MESIEVLTEFARLNEKKSRFEHSLRVAQTAEKLAKKYGLDGYRAKFAGISHDICKDFSNESLIELAQKDGKVIDDLERQVPSLLHGRAAAVLLLEKFFLDPVHDKDIIEAVQNHTFGKVHMCDLAKILYVADKIEPGRPHVNEDYLSSLEKMTLNDLTIFVLKENIDYLESKDFSVALQSYELLKWLTSTENNSRR
ncbi:MAG: bis(5'-nucleosyl)-tetraphosphatase (symmetrical) YqeK [Treponemataceae bacterium]